MPGIHEVFRCVPFPFAGGDFPYELGLAVQTTVRPGGDPPAPEVVHTAENDWTAGTSRARR
jgi:hypothetical protein